jgi:hypothetical protein
MKTALIMTALAGATLTACTNLPADRDLDTSPAGFSAVRHNIRVQSVPTGHVTPGVPYTSGAVQGAAYDRYQTGTVIPPKPISTTTNAANTPSPTAPTAPGG